MKFLVFMLMYLFSVNLKASDSISLIGSWLGYCDPIGTHDGSRLCSYEFKKDNTGIYSCDFFSDLRCETKIKKIFKNNFTYLTPVKEQIKIIYPKDYEYDYELDRIVIDGELMRQVGIEVKKRSDKETYKAFVGPFYFTRKK